MSDQDFFFDEEDEKQAKPAKSAKPAAKSPSKPASNRKPAASAPAPASSGSFFEQNVTVSVASLLVVCGLLVGLIGGVLIGQARANSVANLPSVDQTGAAGQQAPSLTQDQLNSGSLPAGHPSIGGGAGGASGGASGTAAPSQSTSTGK